MPDMNAELLTFSHFPDLLNVVNSEIFIYLLLNERDQKNRSPLRSL